MILIFPWARHTHEGKPSPKNYPCWPEVVERLTQAGYKVLQVSQAKEASIGADRSDDLSLDRIGELLRECQTWLSCDSFVQHMAWTLRQPGVVIFGSSDPQIFGHPENINLLKDRSFLRKRQFGLWSQETQNPDRFVGPGAVIEAVHLSIKNRKRING